MVESFTQFLGKLNEEQEGKMYLQDLEEIATCARQIREMIQPDEELEAWIQDKITIAHHNMEAILGYYKSEKKDTTGTSTGEVTSSNLSNS
jgi:hypothetical protein